MTQTFTEISPEWLKKNIKKFVKKKAVIITGAGISVSSGIPDFRSQNGLFSTIKKNHKFNGKDLFHYRFGHDAETRPVYYKFISELKSIVDNSNPSITHHFFTKFQKYQKKFRLYTQNIDLLEEKAGLTSLIYLHGNLKWLICIVCGYKIEYTEIENDIFKLGKNIECVKCIIENKKRKENKIRQTKIGYLHTNIIHYDQTHHDAYRIARLFESDMDLDLFIVMGTSLKVFGVKEMVKRGLRKVHLNGGIGVFVNKEEPCKEFREMFDFFWRGDCDTFCDEVLNNIKIRKVEKRLSTLNVKKEEADNKNDMEDIKQRREEIKMSKTKKCPLVMDSIEEETLQMKEAFKIYQANRGKTKSERITTKNSGENKVTEVNFKNENMLISARNSIEEKTELKTLPKEREGRDKNLDESLIDEVIEKLKRQSISESFVENSDVKEDERKKDITKKNKSIRSDRQLNMDDNDLEKSVNKMGKNASINKIIKSGKENATIKSVVGLDSKDFKDNQISGKNTLKSVEINMKDKVIDDKLIMENQPNGSAKIVKLKNKTAKNLVGKGENTEREDFQDSKKSTESIDLIHEERKTGHIRYKDKFCGDKSDIPGFDKNKSHRNYTSEKDVHEMIKKVVEKNILLTMEDKMKNIFKENKCNNMEDFAEKGLKDSINEQQNNQELIVKMNDVKTIKLVPKKSQKKGKKKGKKGGKNV